VGDGVGGDASPGAERQRQSLLPAGGVVEVLLPCDRRLAGVDGRDVALGGTHVPPPAARLVGMGGAADAPVVALLPIEQVVPALPPRPGPVGDLVGLEAGPR